MPSLLERDLTDEQRRACAGLGIDITQPARVTYRNGGIVAINGVSLEARERSHFVQNDLPDYQSPITGEIVHGRRGRREDFKKHGCRPYEGREAEEREAGRARAGEDIKLDRLAEKIAHRAWAEAPERVRKVFRSK